MQYRLVIKLSNIISNYDMLIKIAKVIGGNVRITGKGKEVIWTVNNKETVIEIIKIFETYPLLTSRKICQLFFLKKCLLENSVDFYLVNRNNKYINQNFIIKFVENSYLEGLCEASTPSHHVPLAFFNARTHISSLPSCLSCLCECKSKGCKSSIFNF